MQLAVTRSQSLPGTLLYMGPVVGDMSHLMSHMMGHGKSHRLSHMMSHVMSHMIDISSESHESHFESNDACQRLIRKNGTGKEKMKNEKWKRGKRMCNSKEAMQAPGEL